MGSAKEFFNSLLPRGFRVTPQDKRKKIKRVGEKVANPYKTKITLPAGGRVSEQNTGTQGSLLDQYNKLNLILPPFDPRFITIIRKLYKYNPDFGLAVWDHVQLTNTGHKIKFDLSIPPELQDKMRAHLNNKSRTWGDGTNGINGLINKLVAQIWVSGAISVEWVLDAGLTGVNTLAIINPETIRFSTVNGRYAPHQERKFSSLKNNPGIGPIKLNPLTYQYVAIITDEEIPYGIPPLLTAIKEVVRALTIDSNIDNVLDLLGVLGFLEVTLEKPDQVDSSESAYKAQLEGLLNETKTNVLKSMRQGVTVGYKEDHEFNFHSTTKDLNGVDEIYNIIWKKLANGLKTHPAFLSIEGNHSDSSMGIVFTKMLSQLKNIHMALTHVIERGYYLELVLAGFDPKGLKVQFKPSTITDELKYQQAQEIKLRNLQALYDQGIISQDTFAEEFDYEHPDQKKPRVERSNDVLGDAKKKQDREKSKDGSDRKVRDKNKPQPKRKDQKTK